MVRIRLPPAASQRRTPFGLVHSSVTRYGDAATMTAGIVNLTRSDRPSWPLFLERGQPYRRAKDYSAPNRHATDGRRIPPLLKLTMPVEAILQGRQPVELTATRLTELDLPLDWTEQRRLLAS